MDTQPTGIPHLQPPPAARSMRHAYDARVAVSFGGATFDGWSINVSRGGACVMMPMDWQKPVSPSLDGLTVLVAFENGKPRAARAAWQRANRDGLLMGLAYT